MATSKGFSRFSVGGSEGKLQSRMRPHAASGPASRYYLLKLIVTSATRSTGVTSDGSGEYFHLLTAVSTES